MFASDFPHFEGCTDPMGVCRELLKDFSRERLDLFYGASMAEVFARTGDQIA